MNSNAKKWVEALQSGKFKQGKGQLYSEEGYCCLGVATKLYADENPEYTKKYPKWYNQGYLDDEVTEWLGLTNGDGDFWEDGERNNLAQLNDDGVPFQEIAVIIKDEPEGLFK